LRCSASTCVIAASRIITLFRNARTAWRRVRIRFSVALPLISALR
jgi:hypothetical protein